MSANHKRLLLQAAIPLLLTAGTTVQAQQQRTGWATVVDGLALYQLDADLSGGGEFSVNRSFLRAGKLYRSEDGVSYGLFLSYGELSYDFDTSTAAPWGDIRDVRISVPIRFPVSDTATVFLSPQVRWDYEKGVSASDGRTYGVFAGVTWQLGNDLQIGPAFGAFTELGSDDIELFPALLVNWEISEKWSLSTGGGLGASQGPGVSLTYDHSRATSFSLSTRAEKTRFRLDNSGLAPGGIGEDTSLPVVFSFNYHPNPRMSFGAYIGAEFDGELTLEDTSGATVSTQSYGTAPIAGLIFRVRF
ncbi:hypothetical protein SAMN05444000_10854 [Shimia gijangensis]|uniref:Transporter n=1 Tax=Shimia gijangensis TaxID=1470563 RepID=A0A1M6IYY5_9RHOB|nr:hypothetical protein [Shimia gijangensis]SHJ39674.1 hypothetical protein SAMN05444000_10854 [Shimia gijangensis]